MGRRAAVPGGQNVLDSDAACAVVNGGILGDILVTGAAPAEYDGYRGPGIIQIVCCSSAQYSILFQSRALEFCLNRNNVRWGPAAAMVREDRHSQTIP